VAAYQLSDLATALTILRQAEANLPAAEMKGPLWYNRGCLAARLGYTGEALRCLNRAVEAGMSDPARYRADPDLAPLLGNPAFNRLLLSING
jgi:hypothetical protein